MTNEEAIEAIASGLRAETPRTIKNPHLSGRCKHSFGYHLIACNGTLDGIECPICGFQMLIDCTGAEDATA